MGSDAGRRADLKLLRAGHATMETTGTVEDALDHPGIERRNRQLELLPDHVVRQVGQEVEIRMRSSSVYWAEP